ncbi:MAG: PA14 domain-containing protein, partial [Verrucomicrobiales bacterium]
VKDAPKGTAFSVVLGGPSPELITGTPLTHRADVIEVLDNLRPVEGPFRAHDALGMASLSLAEGGGGAKDLLVFTDSQRVGWRFDSPAAWESLGDAWEGMPQKPRLLLRSFELPELVRNAALSELDFSREVVGTDRDLLITVKVENTGTETITPGRVLLEAEGAELEPQAVGQLLPGQEETLQFSHRFTTPGAQVVRVRLEGEDDLAGDNALERALVVRERLPVLLVDGNPSGAFFDRASGYTALALAPTQALLRGGGEKGKFLMDPEVIPASGVASAELENQGIIVLADVSRLPGGVAERLAEFVASGGGLLVLGGEHVEAAFYNDWRGSDGLLMPAALETVRVPEEPVYPASTTFDHEALRLFKGPAGADMEAAVVKAYVASGELREGAIPAARFSDGSLFMATKNYGQGRVMQVMTGFDGRLGNLPVRQSFVPMVHELVTWLGGGRELDLNVAASWNPSLQLAGGQGLLGKYYYRRSQTKRELRLERVDANINFNWNQERVSKKVPNDKYVIEWTGSLVVPSEGGYRFEAEADDRLKMSLDGRVVCETEQRQQRISETVELEPGRAYPLEITYEEESGEAFVRLFWTRPDGKREIVPTSALVATTSDEGEEELAELQATDPRGQLREASLVLGRRGKTLEVAGTAVPGAYLVELEEEIASELSLPTTGLPLVVERDARESRLTKFVADDLVLMRREADVVETGSMQDVLAILSGKGFGKELWKILAVAGFILLLLETALARWVSGSRKMSEEVRVDFESSGAPPVEFMQELEKVKGGKA